MTLSKLFKNANKRLLKIRKAVWPIRSTREVTVTVTASDAVLIDFLLKRDLGRLQANRKAAPLGHRTAIDEDIATVNRLRRVFGKAVK